MKYKVCHFVYSKHGSFIIKVVYLQGNSMKDCPLYSITHFLSIERKPLTSCG